MTNRKLSCEQLMKVANPGANGTNTSLEKKPIMQSTWEEDLKHGISTSSANGSSGNM